MKHGNIRTLTACLLSLLLCLAAFCGCGKTTGGRTEETTSPALWGDNVDIGELDLVSTKTAPAPVIPTYGGGDTLRAVTGKLSDVYSPFFASEEGETDVTALTQVPLLGYERGGRVITRGVEGQTFSFNGTEYLYHGIADCEVSLAADGGAVYDIRLREDVFFSDGVNLTADDVIFTMYVLSDPTYDGEETFCRLPVEGLSEYRSGMTLLCDVIYQDKSKGTSYRLYDSTDEAVFLDKLEKGGVAYASSVRDAVLSEFGREDYYQSSFGGKWGSIISENEGLKTAFSMVVWGCAEWEEDAASGILTGNLTDITGKVYDCRENYPTASDFFRCIRQGYDTMSDLMAGETGGDGLAACLRESFGGDYARFFEVAVNNGVSASVIGGIEKTGMYSLKLHMTTYDATVINGLCFCVAPLHYYGSRDAYRYTENRFGFPKGDLRTLHDKDRTPLGAGAYLLTGMTEGNCTLSRNELYYLGCPYVKEIRLYECGEVNGVSRILDGDADLVSTELTTELVRSLIAAGEDGQLSGNKIAFSPITEPYYGYIGINAETVRVGTDRMSEASSHLRRALCVVLSSVRDDAIRSYYGERADVIEYPLPSSSYAYPSDGKRAYTERADGTAIYTEEMSRDEKERAILREVTDLLIAAGFTYNEKAGRFTGAPEGASLTYTFAFCGNGKNDSPAYPVARAAATLLSEKGITLTLTDTGTQEDLLSLLRSGKAQLWGAAWESGADPDLYQIYYSRNIPTSRKGTGSNYFYLTDDVLDEKIAECRRMLGDGERIAAYRDCYERIFSFGVQVPLYQKYRAFLVCRDRISPDAGLTDLTAFTGWTALAHTIKLS